MNKGGKKEKKRKKEININKKKYDEQKDNTKVNNMRLDRIIILISMNNGIIRI